MKINAVYKRESTVSARSFRLPLILFIFNGILAIVALLNMYSVIVQVEMTAELQYTSFLSMYVFVTAVEFVILMFLMPALTAGSISGERERQTLDLMLTTTIKPWEIIAGKIVAAGSNMLLLIVSSFPILALGFIYGGVMLQDVMLMILCYMAVALLTGSIGICFSAFMKHSAIATAVTYGILILVAAGTYAINLFSMSVVELNVRNTYMYTVGNGVSHSGTGGLAYLLLLNPVTTFYVLIKSQIGAVDDLGPWPSARVSPFIAEHWVAVSITVQLFMAFLFIVAAVYAITPSKQKKKEKRD